MEALKERAPAEGGEEAGIYARVPQPEREKYLAFSRTHAAQSAAAGGHPFTYIAAGSGPRTLLLLPGLLGDAASLYQQIVEFERDHRVLALSYPDTAELAPQLDAIRHLLDREGVDRVVAVGQTLGGYLAQELARAEPARVEALVLVHAGLPNPALGAELRRDQRLIRLLPYPLVRRFLHGKLKSMAARLEQSGEVGSAQAQAIAAHFVDRFSRRLDKRRVTARYGLMANLHRLPPSRADEVRRLAGRVLLLHTEGNLFSRDLEAMKALYPGARACSMGRRHNISLLIKPEESNRHIRELLATLSTTPQKE